MSTWAQFSFQDSISPTMEEFMVFHDKVTMVTIFIVLSIGGALTLLCMNTLYNKKLMEGQVIEWIWTTMPGMTLVLVAIPSLSLLYMYDEPMNYSLSVKAVGHQWFWSYEILNPMNNFDPYQFEAYMLPKSMPEYPGMFRLLDTDSRLIIPLSTPVQVLVTSEDVLHAWAVPSMGVKADAIPGRLNLISLFSYNPGIFFGQCSEICGANHSFMPIVIEVIGAVDFIYWLYNSMNL